MYAVRDQSPDDLLTWLLISTCLLHLKSQHLQSIYNQCWGKQLLKVMHNNTAFTHWKVTNSVIFLCKFSHLGWACLFV